MTAQQLIFAAGLQDTSLDLGFMSGVLDPRITYSRADTAPVASYFDSGGTMRFGPINLLLNSGSADLWAFTSAILATANATVAPDGTTTAAKIAGVSGPTFHYVGQSGTIAAGSNITASVYVKAAGDNFSRIDIQNAGNTNALSATFNLSTGVISVAANTIGAATGASATITAVGNGWYRCTVSGILDAVSTSAKLVTFVHSGAYVGDSINGIYVWGGQLEQNTAATPYTPTTGAVLCGPRFDYDPSTAWMNQIRNSIMVGAVTGTPGTLPTNWGGITAAGLSTSVIGTGTESGISYIDIRFFGTSTGTVLNMPTDGITAIQAAQGQTWTTSFYHRLVGGTLANVNLFQISLYTYTSAPAFLNSTLTTIASPTAQPLASQRFSASWTLPDATTAFIRQVIPQITIVNGAAIDFTLRIGGPQLERGSVANPFVPTSGVATGRGATARGLLIEEARTNSIRNSTMVGAVIGTPGTLPTNWSAVVAIPSLPHAVVGFGTDAAGWPYIDLRFVGTASGTGSFILAFDSTIAASAGQAWTQSLYVRLVGGSLTGNISGFTLQTNVNGVSTATAPFTLTTTTQRPAAMVASTIGGTTTVQPYLAFGCASGVATDFTIRIGGPQLEIGAFTTSYIPTVAAAVTRAADVATMTPPGLGYPFAMVVDALLPQLVGIAGLLVMDDGTANTRISMRTNGNTLSAIYLVSSVTNINQTSGNMTIGAPFRFGLAALSGGLTVAHDGIDVATASGAGPAWGSLTTLRLGQNALNASFLNGYLRRIRYWSRVLSNPELQQATS